MKVTRIIYIFPLNNGSFAVLKRFENIRKHSWNARKSQGDPQKSYEELGIFGVLRLSHFVSSLTADHYFWCSGGVPGCLEGVLGYCGMFLGVSGCSGGVPGVFRVLQTPIFPPHFWTKLLLRGENFWTLQSLKGVQVYFFSKSRVIRW